MWFIIGDRSVNTHSRDALCIVVMGFISRICDIPFPFAALDRERQVALLEGIERADASEIGMGIGVAFFKDIKDRTIFAYYTSRAGLLEELGYRGNAALLEFPGCDHPKHLR